MDSNNDLLYINRRKNKPWFIYNTLSYHIFIRYVDFSRFFWVILKLIFVLLAIPPPKIADNFYGLLSANGW